MWVQISPLIILCAWVMDQAGGRGCARGCTQHVHSMPGTCGQGPCMNLYIFQSDWRDQTHLVSAPETLAYSSPSILLHVFWQQCMKRVDKLTSAPWGELVIVIFTSFASCWLSMYFLILSFWCPEEEDRLTLLLASAQQRAWISPEWGILRAATIWLSLVWFVLMEMDKCNN